MKYLQRCFADSKLELPPWRTADAVKAMYHTCLADDRGCTVGAQLLAEVVQMVQLGEIDKVVVELGGVNRTNNQIRG